MSALSIQPTYPIFTETDGQPLENGYIWIGQANLDPQTNLIQVYWDAGLTQLAAQPIRTQGGYPSRAGSPARLYVNSDYSIRVMDANGVLVYGAPAATERYGNVITGLTAADISFTPAGNNAVTRTVEDKLLEYISRDDYATQADAVTQLIASEAFYLNNRDDFEITVGTFGVADATSINDALEIAVRMRPNWKEGNSGCTIRLLTGFVMREQVLLSGGTDFGWIKIVADDAVTVIDETYVTAFLDQLDALVPAFGARENSVLPTIGCQFSYNNNATAKDGVAVILGSKVGFMPETGVIRARNGLKILYDSEAYCYMEGLTVGGDGTGAGTVTGVNFSYAANRGCHIAYGSRALLARSNFSYSGGDYGVYCIWGSYGDLYQSNASYAAGTAFIARDGSFLNCRGSNGSHSKRAFHALHNGRINARSSLTGPTMIWIGDGAKGCSEYGVLASACSHIDADSLNCDDNTGSAAVSASGASSINFSGGSARNSANRGVWSVGSSIVDALGVNVSGGLQAGFVAEQGGTINCENGIATDCVTTGVFASSGSRINAQGVDASRCNRGVEGQEGCMINFRNGIANDCGERGVSAIDGSIINCQDASMTNAAVYGVTCRSAGNVSANNANCSGAGSNGVYVLSGGIVSFTGGSGTTNITVNTLAPAGIIFQ